MTDLNFNVQLLSGEVEKHISVVSTPPSCVSYSESAKLNFYVI